MTNYRINKNYKEMAKITEENIKTNERTIEFPSFIEPLYKNKKFVARSVFYVVVLVNTVLNLLGVDYQLGISESDIYNVVTVIGFILGGLDAWFNDQPVTKKARLEKEVAKTAVKEQDVSKKSKRVHI